MGTLYRYDPYNVSSSVKFLTSSQVPTLHLNLVGHVTFVPYPHCTIPLPQPQCHKHDLVRLFMGQLPYSNTDEQLQWLSDTFANGAPLFHTERIIKWKEQQPKGCVHTYCYPEHATEIMGALHKMVLVDDSGVWYASSVAEHVHLEAYCALMKKDKSLRFRDRPYQSVVVQTAHSTFVPRLLPTPPPVLFSQNPPEYIAPPTYHEEL